MGTADAVPFLVFLDRWGRIVTDNGWNFNGSTQNETLLKPLCLEVERRFKLPPKRLLRYFAVFDDESLTSSLGQYFRGLHVPNSGRHALPLYLLHSFFREPQVGMTFEDTIVFDNLIYIRRNTCFDPVGCVTTYAKGRSSTCGWD